ncbi:HupE/UreJ family protein [Nocardioides sp. BP30]|uniref:HupE/UreJ family protein n=1 Tax=Nocardioides sp. BP30 TaxID=3036374 RepID=UPI0024699D5E|nr:HupE/UreJ family protein [Nocardioides sp. BP30]WGL51163.1 HupE/UreJ family protein [Nocardioides sp. BP30]
MSRLLHGRCRDAVALLLTTVAMLLFVLTALAGPSQAHGLTSVVYVDMTSPERGVVRVDLGLEYDLFEVSVADYEHDDALYRAGQPAWDDGDAPGMAKAMDDNKSSTLRYIADHFHITGSGKACTTTSVSDATIKMRQGVPYAFVDVDYACDPNASVHDFTTTFFNADEGYVKGTTTIATYDLDMRHGSAALEMDQTSFSTHQSFGQRFGEFYRLGTHHLLTGIDHLLFLAALIVGSRRLREVVLGATTFTIAHLVTLALTALGIVHVSENLVEPLIALSIAAVAGWHLVRLWRRGSHATDIITASRSHFALDRAGYLRLGVVFFFGLIHGMGFAGALGIDNPWSWTLLWSLLVFSIGIESVQIGLIVLIFPILALIRHRSPRVGLWVSGSVAAVVAIFGLLWFVQRVWDVAHGAQLS